MLFNISIVNKKLRDNTDVEISCLWNHLGSLHDIDPQTRINIKASNISPEELDKLYTELNVVKEKFPSYTVACKQFSLLKNLIQAGYNAYLDHAITDWELFNNLKELGVSDILIDGPLGFSMDALKSIKENVKIRVCPQFSPNAELNTSSNLNSFFIRPEDLKYYESCVDIIDFRSNSTEQEETYFNIYTQGYYLFDLSLLISQLNTNINNNYVHNDFGPNRLNCHQRCKDPTRGPCHLCESLITLGQRLEPYHKAISADA